MQICVRHVSIDDTCQQWGQMDERTENIFLGVGWFAFCSCLMVKTEDIDENGNAANVGDDEK